MKSRGVLGSVLAAWVFLPGCGGKAMVLSSVDSGLQVDSGLRVDPGLKEEAGVSGVSDGALGSTDGPAFQGDGSEQGPDTGTVADAQPSDGSDAAACGACTGGMTCQGGQCACPSGLSSCSGICVDEQVDDGNCGGCGILCSTNPPSVAACTGGRCIVTLAYINGPISPEAIVVDGTSVYWTSATGGVGWVSRVSTEGGTVTTLATTVAPNGEEGAIPAGIALDATSVYWTDNGSLGTDNGTPGDVMKVPTAGGTVTPLASGQDNPCVVAVDATSVYWMAGCNVENSGSVMKVPISGGTPITLASGQTFPVPPGYVPIGFTVNEANVYWTTGDSVMTVPTDGGTVTALASAQSFQNGNGLAVDEANVYWTTTDSVMKVSTDGGAATPLAFAQTSPLISPYHIAVDGANVYWMTGGGVMKVSTAGGTPTVLTSPGGGPNGVIAVDATSVYWMTGLQVFSPGYILMKVTPK
jgi:hypothetical protein